MGLGHAAIGIGATLLSKFLSLKTWTLTNNDSREVLKGQFPAENVTRGAGSNYQVTTALNRQNPIIQFINGELDTLSVQSRFWRKDLFDEAPTDRIDKLLEWTRVDKKLRRPPILTFALGDGLGLTMQVVLEKVDSIVYGNPNALGGIREVSFSLSMRSQVPFDINETEVTDTRYHRVKEGEFYELIAQREYGNPMLGIFIRRLHPTKPIANPGDVVKLPAVETARIADLQPDSTPLKTAFGNKDTEQRRNRIRHFELRSESSVSFLFQSARK